MCTSVVFVFVSMVSNTSKHIHTYLHTQSIFSLYTYIYCISFLRYVCSFLLNCRHNVCSFRPFITYNCWLWSLNTQVTPFTSTLICWWYNKWCSMRIRFCQFVSKWQWIDRMEECPKGIVTCHNMTVYSIKWYYHIVESHQQIECQMAFEMCHNNNYLSEN